MSYVYIKSERAGHQGAEHDLFTVGFYDPSGAWQPDSDHIEEDNAAVRVNWLNGGRDAASSATAPLDLLRQAVEELTNHGGAHVGGDYDETCSTCLLVKEINDTIGAIDRNTA